MCVDLSGSLECFGIPTNLEKLEKLVRTRKMEKNPNMGKKSVLPRTRAKSSVQEKCEGWMGVILGRGKKIEEQ